jgi:two-component system, OmpR family, alkaline phosphatase synthesis response regulator PhoP
MTSRVLIIEDNADLAAGLRYNLELEGYTVDLAEDGNAGLELALSTKPDVVVLDLMLPGIDGYQVLQSMRAQGSRVPVLILTARGEEADKVRGFRLDADQYVTKPFGLMELLERIRSLIRRSTGTAAAPAGVKQIRFGDVCIDPSSRRVDVRGESVTLTPKAYELMLSLIRRKGAVASRVELLREVWGHRGLVLTRTVDSHVAELRRKLEKDAADPRHFITVWKVGYRFDSAE